MGERVELEQETPGRTAAASAVTTSATKRPTGRIASTSSLLRSSITP